MILPHCCSCTCSLLVRFCALHCKLSSRCPSIHPSVCLGAGESSRGLAHHGHLLYLRNLFYSQGSKQIAQLATGVGLELLHCIRWYLLVLFVGHLFFSLLCSCCFWYFSRVCLFVFVSRRASLSVGKQNLFVNKAVTSLRLLSLLLSPITHTPPPPPPATLRIPFPCSFAIAPRGKPFNNRAQIFACRNKLALLLFVWNRTPRTQRGVWSTEYGVRSTGVRSNRSNTCSAVCLH